METARLTSKGQVTIPKAIRDRLKLEEGDRLALTEENGNILITKSSTNALRHFLDSMAEESQKNGITEKELLNDLEIVREEMWNEKRN